MRHPSGPVWARLIRERRDSRSPGIAGGRTAPPGSTIEGVEVKEERVPPREEPL
jgi:hypothetical protein